MRLSPSGPFADHRAVEAARFSRPYTSPVTKTAIFWGSGLSAYRRALELRAVYEMRTLEARKAYHVAEIARLNGNIEAALVSYRNVDLDRALIVQHTVEIAELERAVIRLQS